MPKGTRSQVFGISTVGAPEHWRPAAMEGGGGDDIFHSLFLRAARQCEREDADAAAAEALAADKGEARSTPRSSRKRLGTPGAITSRHAWDGYVASLALHGAVTPDDRKVLEAFWVR